MQRNDNGTVTLDRSEARLFGAALWTIEHYMDQVWDETEVSAVSGYPVENFRAARRQLDGLRTADDEQADITDRVQVNLALFESRSDEDLSERRASRALRGTLNEAWALGLPVSERLARLSQGD